MVWNGRVAAPVVAFAALAIATGAQVAGEGLAGTWEYRQANAARPDGLDAEGERLIVVRQADGRLTGQYFGLEREGEHGLLYTAVDLGALRVAADGSIAFSVPARTLYRSRPATLADAGRLAPAGRTSDVLAFSGRFSGDTLVLACTSVPGACPDRRLVFRRLTTPNTRRAASPPCRGESSTTASTSTPTSRPLTSSPEVSPTTQCAPGASRTSARLTTGPATTGNMRRRVVGVDAQPLPRASATTTENPKAGKAC